MKLVFSWWQSSGMVECPFCRHHGQIESDGIDDYYVWCERCKQWFELGFQIHSED